MTDGGDAFASPVPQTRRPVEGSSRPMQASAPQRGPGPVTSQGLTPQGPTQGPAQGSTQGPAHSVPAVRVPGVQVPGEVIAEYPTPPAARPQVEPAPGRPVDPTLGAPWSGTAPVAETERPAPAAAPETAPAGAPVIDSAKVAPVTETASADPTPASTEETPSPAAPAAPAVPPAPAAAPSPGDEATGTAPDASAKGATEAAPAEKPKRGAGMAAGGQAAQVPPNTTPAPQFPSRRHADAEYVPDEDFDFSDLSNVNRELNRARARLFRVSDQLRQAQEAHATAQAAYSRALRRELVQITGGSAETRKAMAELRCEPLENDLIVSAQIVEEWKKRSQNARDDLDAIQNLSHNVRAQLGIR